MRWTYGLGLALTVIFAACDGRDPTPGGDDDGAPAIDGGVDVVDAGTTPQPGDPPDGGAPGAPDGGTSPPDDGCAVAPTGDWQGTARFRHGGLSSYTENRADVTWTRASTEACVDRYTPSGTRYHYNEVDDTTTSEPIAASDGELVVDRSAAPATYDLRGPVGNAGTTLVASGAFDGAAISGGYDDDFNAIEWLFTRVDTSFPVPDGCAEPSSAQWTGTGSVSWGAVATLTWTRISTEGCIDRYQPAGTATIPASNPSCTTTTADPPSAPIEADDGELVIDRSTAPPTFRIRGETSWPATFTCARPDGSVETSQRDVGGPWAWYVLGHYDGDAWRGTTRYVSQDFAWSLARTP